MRDEIIEIANQYDPDGNPKILRLRHGLTQEEMAAALRVSVRTLEGWEQGRRSPQGPTRRLLELFGNHPEVFAQ